ncbi:MAG: hypothetical protein CME69_12380 [Halobacteriovorax sp.]|nr:hypothetical protein [Halobacteriovorax sp.]
MTKKLKDKSETVLNDGRKYLIKAIFGQHTLNLYEKYKDLQLKNPHELKKDDQLQIKEDLFEKKDKNED